MVNVMITLLTFKCIEFVARGIELAHEHGLGLWFFGTTRIGGILVFKIVAWITQKTGDIIITVFAVSLVLANVLGAYPLFLARALRSLSSRSHHPLAHFRSLTSTPARAAACPSYDADNADIQGLYIALVVFYGITTFSIFAATAGITSISWMFREFRHLGKEGYNTVSSVPAASHVESAL